MINRKGKKKLKGIVYVYTSIICGCFFPFFNYLIIVFVNFLRLGANEWGEKVMAMYMLFLLCLTYELLDIFISYLRQATNVRNHFPLQLKN